VTTLDDLMATGDAEVPRRRWPRLTLLTMAVTTAALTGWGVVAAAGSGLPDVLRHRHHAAPAHAIEGSPHSTAAAHAAP
jgi:hypothetical protein